MASASKFAAAGTASLLVAGAWLGALVSVAAAQAQVPAARAPAQRQAAAPAPSATNCEETAEVAVLPSPLAPWKGAPLRVIVAAEKPFEGELSLVAPNGSVAAKSRERHGGPPYFWFAEVATPAAGKWLARLARDGATGPCSTITRDIAVHDQKPPRLQATAGSVWPIRNAWTRANENLYSAWIEKLFDAPLDAAPSWAALHEVLRDKSRNLLFNHLALGEDEMRMVIRPDCADLPYFLRAYFAFKMGLPFGYAKCTRGSASGPPRCPEWWNIQNLEPPPPPPPDPAIAAGSPAGMPGQPNAGRGPRGMRRRSRHRRRRRDLRGGLRRHRPDLWRRPRQRRSRRGSSASRPGSATISARPSPAASIRDPAEPPRPTTRPITTRCR